MRKTCLARPDTFGDEPIHRCRLALTLSWRSLQTVHHCFWQCSHQDQVPTSQGVNCKIRMRHHLSLGESDVAPEQLNQPNCGNRAPKRRNLCLVVVPERLKVDAKTQDPVIECPAIRRWCMEMSYDVSDKDGINICIPKYTFSHPNGLHFYARRAPIALIAIKRAVLQDTQVFV